MKSTGFFPVNPHLVTRRLGLPNESIAAGGWRAFFKAANELAEIESIKSIESDGGELYRIGFNPPEYFYRVSIRVSEYRGPDEVGPGLLIWAARRNRPTPFGAQA